MHVNIDGGTLFRPYLAWSVRIAAISLNLGHLVRENIPSVSLACTVDLAIYEAFTPTQRYSLRERKR